MAINNLDIFALREMCWYGAGPLRRHCRAGSGVGEGNRAGVKAGNHRRPTPIKLISASKACAYGRTREGEVLTGNTAACSDISAVAGIENVSSAKQRR